MYKKCSALSHHPELRDPAAEHKETSGPTGRRWDQEEKQRLQMQNPLTTDKNCSREVKEISTLAAYNKIPYPALKDRLLCSKTKGRRSICKRHRRGSRGRRIKLFFIWNRRGGAFLGRRNRRIPIPSWICPIIVLCISRQNGGHHDILNTKWPRPTTSKGEMTRKIKSGMEALLIKNFINYGNGSFRK